MKLKQRIGDFRVRELLDEAYLVERGDYRVYRVTKRKLTTPEAVDLLAREAGVESGDVGVAGWKDRQAITVQYMSVRRGRPVRIQDQELKIDTVGFAREPFDSEKSRGNAFEISVRGLSGADIHRLRKALPMVREHGLVNYFDDQRFGNLSHGQGWIAKRLMLGRFEDALRELLATPNERDDDRHRRFKTDVGRSWGDWKACRDAAGRFGAHHSIFEHLAKNPGDFKGAFDHVSTRLKLIHLYGWQSHLWNRAVCDLVRTHIPLERSILMDGLEGVLVGFTGHVPEELSVRKTVRLPGEGLADLRDEDMDLFEDVLAREGLVPDQLRLEGMGGFQLKGEERPLLVHARHLRVRPAEEDKLNRGARMLKLRFELPRGSYASLVVKRLFALSPADRAERERRGQRGEDRSSPGRPQGGRSEGRERSSGSRDRGAWRERSPGDRPRSGEGGLGGQFGTRGDDRAPWKGRRSEGGGDGQRRTGGSAGWKGGARNDDRAPWKGRRSEGGGDGQRRTGGSAGWKGGARNDDRAPWKGRRSEGGGDGQRRTGGSAGWKGGARNDDRAPWKGRRSEGGGDGQRRTGGSTGWKGGARNDDRAPWKGRRSEGGGDGQRRTGGSAGWKGGARNDDRAPWKGRRSEGGGDGQRRTGGSAGWKGGARNDDRAPWKGRRSEGGGDGQRRTGGSTGWKGGARNDDRAPWKGRRSEGGGDGQRRTGGSAGWKGGARNDDRAPWKGRRSEGGGDGQRRTGGSAGWKGGARNDDRAPWKGRRTGGRTEDARGGGSQGQYRPGSGTGGSRGAQRRGRSDGGRRGSGGRDGGFAQGGRPADDRTGERGSRGRRADREDPRRGTDR